MIVDSNLVAVLIVIVAVFVVGRVGAGFGGSSGVGCCVKSFSFVIRAIDGCIVK